MCDNIICQFLKKNEGFQICFENLIGEINKIKEGSSNKDTTNSPLTGILSSPWLTEYINNYVKSDDSLPLLDLDQFLLSNKKKDSQTEPKSSKRKAKTIDSKLNVENKTKHESCMQENEVKIVESEKETVSSIGKGKGKGKGKNIKLLSKLLQTGGGMSESDTDTENTKKMKTEGKKFFIIYF